MEIDFLDNSDILGSGRDIEVSVRQGPVGVTSTTLLSAQAPTQHSMVLAVQCATVLTCAPLPLLGTSAGGPLPVQITNVAAPMLVQGTVLPPVTRAAIHMQGPTFPLVASAPMPIQGAQGAPVQGAAMPLMTGGAAAPLPMAGALMLSQGTQFPGTYMAPHSWPMYMPSFLPRAQAAPPTTLSGC